MLHERNAKIKLKYISTSLVAVANKADIEFQFNFTGNPD